MGALYYTFKKGTRLGSRRGGDVVADRDIKVEVLINQFEVERIALSAARNLNGKSKSGPVSARVRR